MQACFFCSVYCYWSDDVSTVLTDEQEQNVKPGQLSPTSVDWTHEVKMELHPSLCIHALSHDWVTDEDTAPIMEVKTQSQQNLSGTYELLLLIAFTKVQYKSEIIYSGPHSMNWPHRDKDDCSFSFPFEISKFSFSEKKSRDDYEA